MNIYIYNMTIKQSSCIIFQGINIYESVSWRSQLNLNLNLLNKLYSSLSIINKLKYKLYRQ